MGFFFLLVCHIIMLWSQIVYWRRDVAHSNAIPKPNVETTLIFRLFYFILQVFFASTLNSFTTFLHFFTVNRDNYYCRLIFQN